MPLTKNQEANIKLDLYTKKKYNMSEEQFEEYIERLGIALYDGGLSMQDAYRQALREVGIAKTV